jgi:hypothetical protein
MLANELFKIPELEQFVLVGGTAITLLIANRRSIDIDLFCTDAFENDRLLAILKEHRLQFTVQSMSKGAILGYINTIKTDFIRHDYPWIEPPKKIDGLNLASLKDLAAMKLNAIVGSGSRLKDFVDISFLSAHFNLMEMLDFYEKKYPDINSLMAMKSLCYFDDIDFSVDIEYIGSKRSWEEIKYRLIQMVSDPQKKFPPL